MAASRGSTLNKMFPAATLEDQEAVMAGEAGTVVVGIPPFSSQAPHTDGHRMVSIEGGAAMAADEDKKAKDWNKEVKSATSLDQLSALKARYDDSGAKYDTTKAAFDKKQTELEEAAEGSDDQN